MEPLDALTEANREEPAPESAASAAAWLHNPNAIEKRKTTAQILAEMRPYDPALDGPEEE